MPTEVLGFLKKSFLFKQNEGLVHRSDTVEVSEKTRLLHYKFAAITKQSGKENLNPRLLRGWRKHLALGSGNQFGTTLP